MGKSMYKKCAEIVNFVEARVALTKHWPVPRDWASWDVMQLFEAAEVEYDEKLATWINQIIINNNHDNMHLKVLDLVKAEEEEKRSKKVRRKQKRRSIFMSDEHHAALTEAASGLPSVSYLIRYLIEELPAFKNRQFAKKINL